LSLFIVLTLCTAEFVRKCSWVSTTRFLNENVHSRGGVKVSNLVNRLVHEFTVLAPEVVLKIIFYKLKTNLWLDELPPEIFLVSLLKESS